MGGVGSALPQPASLGPAVLPTGPVYHPDPGTTVMTLPVSYTNPPNMVLVGAVHPLSSEFSRKSPLTL